MLRFKPDFFKKKEKTKIKEGEVLEGATKVGEGDGEVGNELSEKKAEALSKQTEADLADIQELMAGESFEKQTPGKKKIIIDKVKLLLATGIALGMLGLAVFYKDFETASTTTAGLTATKESILAGLSLLTALGGGIAFKLRSIYQKFKKEEA